MTYDRFCGNGLCANITNQSAHLDLVNLEYSAITIHLHFGE